MTHDRVDSRWNTGVRRWLLACSVSMAVSAMLPSCGTLTEQDRTTITPGRHASSSRIVGGQDVSVNKHPHQVALYFKHSARDGDFFCGGSVIGSSAVLTANHCVDGLRADDVHVVAGMSRLSEINGQLEPSVLPAGVQTRGVRRIVRYHTFDRPEDGGIVGDVAVLALAAPFDLSTERVKAIEILHPDEASAAAAGNSGVITGWGLAQYDWGDAIRVDTLQEASLTIVSDQEAVDLLDEADPFFFGQLEPPFIQQVVGKSDEQGACYGDSGGPFVVTSDSSEKRLAGVTSWGPLACDAPSINVFARVSDFADWVDDVVASLAESPVDDAPYHFSTTVKEIVLAPENEEGSNASFIIPIGGADTGIEVFMRADQKVRMRVDVSTGTYLAKARDSYVSADVTYWSAISPQAFVGCEYFQVTVLNQSTEQSRVRIKTLLATREHCGDGIDNDLNQATDCEDPSCSAVAGCSDTVALPIHQNNVSHMSAEQLNGGVAVALPRDILRADIRWTGPDTGDPRVNYVTIHQTQGAAPACTLHVNDVCSLEAPSAGSWHVEFHDYEDDMSAERQYLVESVIEVDAVVGAIPSSGAEICDNGIDDDLDGDTDCDDPVCGLIRGFRDVHPACVPDDASEDDSDRRGCSSAGGSRRTVAVRLATFALLVAWCLWLRARKERGRAARHMVADMS